MPNRMKVLVVEDDEVLGMALNMFMQLEGHQSELATRLSEADTALRTATECREPFDAYLVDWQLPDGEGTRWIAARRATGDATASIMLTAKDQLQDRIDGLDAGADDYLVKPFELDELNARLRAVMRRYRGTALATAGLADPQVLGELSIHRADRSLRRLDQIVALSPSEWLLIERLSRSVDAVVAREELDTILAPLQRGDAPSSLEVHLSRLRRKIGHRLIQNLRGQGYRLLSQAPQRTP